MNTLLLGPLGLGPADYAQLFVHFALLSLLAIGGAITTVPEMQRWVVEQRGWLGDAQFNGSIALAQAAPGPNVLFVAVIGFNVAGLAGVLATLGGSLLPSTLVALNFSRWVEPRREAPGVRAFVKGGFADLSRVHAWTQEFVGSSPEGQRYEQLATEIERALRFMRACGVDTENTATLHEADVYTSHEALLLGYEEALTRQDSLTGQWYDCSAHMLWIGERTRQMDGAHIEFLRGVGNPLGCKIGPSTTVDFVLELCQALNPARVPGRLTLISRMGADKVEDALRPLLRAVRDSGHPVVWACDPMHGNTFTSVGGRKTRHFDDIIREISGFVNAHRMEGTWPGGIHVELTGDNVTECLGGADDLTDADLDDRYQTVCDPRLNARQGLDLAFGVAELIRSSGFA